MKEILEQIAEKKMLEWWNHNKGSKGVVLQKIQTLTMKIKERRNAILSSFGQAKTIKEVVVSSDESIAAKELSTSEQENNGDCQVVDQNNMSNSDGAKNSAAHAPVQLKVKVTLLQVDAELVTLLNARNSGLSLSNEQVNRLKVLRKTKEDLTKKLKRLQTLQSSSIKHREKVKTTVNRLRQSDPEAAKDLQSVMPQTIGKPRLERDQPDLMDTIIRIVTHHSSADERRRTETLRSMKTLNQLHKIICGKIIPTHILLLQL